MSRSENQTELSRANVTGSIEPANKQSDKEHKYHCQYCDSAYENELLTRVHITRSEDSSHLNYNGFMPEVSVDIVDHDGEVVNTVSRRPEDFDISTLTVDDFPDDCSEQHKYILLVATNNYNETNYTTLTEKVENRLNEYDIEAPSYSTIRRVIRSFYRPHLEDRESDVKQGTNNESLSDLTTKQQAIIITRLLSDAKPATIAKQVSCAQSYPSQVFDRAEHIIDSLDTRIEKNKDPEEVLQNELTEEDIVLLEESGALAGIPVEFDKLDNEERDVTETNELWGSPVGKHGVMTAAPEDQTQQTSETESSTIEQTVIGDRNNKEKSSLPESEEDAGQTESKGDIPRNEVAKLKEKVEFLRDTFDRSNRSDHQIVVSVAQQIEQSCETMLQKQSET